VRQSLELARKCKALVNAHEGLIAQLHENRPFKKTSIKQHEIEFPNGSRIIALAPIQRRRAGLMTKII
jgi:hypothetical protein